MLNEIGYRHTHVAYGTPALSPLICTTTMVAPPVGKILPTMLRLAAIYLSEQQMRSFPG